MFYKRTSFPEEGELVLCTVTKVQSHSVFVRLDEFDKSGMIHISEISAGRIRNIRDFVKEDKVIVCVVLRVNMERGYIDLSLRRVNEGQRRKKIEEIKQEQKAEKIIETLAEQLKKKPEEVYRDIYGAVSKYYTFLYQCFQDVVKGEMVLEDVEIQSLYLKPLTEIIQQRMKPKELYVGGKLFLQSYAPQGVEILKDALLAGAQQDTKNVQLRYLGGGAYDVSVKGEEYKEAEKILNKVLKSIETHIPKGKAIMDFRREEKKAVAGV